MSALADPRISALQEQAGPSGELDLPVGEGCFRINLLDDNIALWQETFKQQTAPANLLLACAGSSGELKDTRLTWVVGSAIRTATASGLDAVAVRMAEPTTQVSCVSLSSPLLPEQAKSKLAGAVCCSNVSCQRAMLSSSRLMRKQPSPTGRSSSPLGPACCCRAEILGSASALIQNHLQNSM